VADTTDVATTSKISQPLLSKVYLQGHTSVASKNTLEKKKNLTWQHVANIITQHHGDVDKASCNDR